MAPSPRALAVTALALLAGWTAAFPYDPAQVAFNLNQNRTATDPAQYWGQWENHTYFPSPKNWRFPYYTVRRGSRTRGSN